MANYTGFILTNVGRNLLARAVANETKINFTKLGIGSGYNTGDDKPLTQLVNQKNEYSLNTLKKTGNQVDITFIISNRRSDGSSAIDSAYKISELGVFAKDDTGIEILYAYNKSADGDYIPAYNGNNLMEIENKLTIIVDEAASVTGIVDSSLTFLTTQNAEEYFVQKTQVATETEAGLVTLTDVQQEILKSYTQNLNIPGYMKLSNGLTIQWLNAQYDQATSASGTTVSFPMAFNNACLAIFAMDRAGGCNSMGAAIINRFQGRIWAMQINGAIYATTNVVIMAIGY